MSPPDFKPLRMTVAEFIPWAMAQPEGKRYELAHGEVIAMAPEKNWHVIVKQEVWWALDGVSGRRLVRISGRPCD
jgi:Uma2 family endonuclease